MVVICSNVYFLHGFGVGGFAVHITQDCVDHRLLAGLTRGKMHKPFLQVRK